MKNFKGKICMSFPKILRDLTKKINDEILLLAFGLSILITVITICCKSIPEWTGMTLVLIFLIATIYFFLMRLANMLIHPKGHRKKGVCG